MTSKTAKPVRRSAAIVLMAGVAVGATSAHGATIGAPVTLGAAADNSTIKITYGSYSSVVSAAPVGVYAISYITPDANWATTGAVDITFQIFNPGGLNSGSIPKISQGIGYNPIPTASAGLQYTSTTSAAVASVVVPTVGTITATGSSFSGSNEYPTGASIPASGTYDYVGATGSTITGPTSPSTGGGNIITWILTPNAGKKIYVSDFYNTPIAGGLGIYSGFHLQGVNASSSFIGAQSPDIIYVTPEPGTWAAIVGMGALVGWQGYSRRRRPVKESADIPTPRGR